MRVITEFVKNDLSEDQLLPVVQDLVPALLSVLGNPQVCVPLDSSSRKCRFMHPRRGPRRCMSSDKSCECSRQSRTSTLRRSSRR
jgi:hypothetical protein